MFTCSPQKKIIAEFIKMTHSKGLQKNTSGPTISLVLQHFLCIWTLSNNDCMLVSVSVLRPYAAHCIKLVCMTVIPEWTPLLKMMHKKACKQFDDDKQTKDMDYWNQDKLIWFRWCQACCGNPVRSTKTSVSCLQLNMVVGVSWSGAAWVLPTCTVTYWSRAWSPPFEDWAAGQYSKMITTPSTSPRCPLPC